MTDRLNTISRWGDTLEYKVCISPVCLSARRYLAFRRGFLALDMAKVLLLAAGVALWARLPTTAHAQCGDNPPDSSCVTCHEIKDPIYGEGEWHIIHAREDCCTNCHGGNCGAMDKDLAHEGLEARPLEDIYTNCYPCHPGDYEAYATRYGALLGVTPASRTTPTAVPVAPVVEHPIVILQPSIPISSAPQPWLLALAGLAFTGIFLLSLGLIYYRLHT